MKKFFAVLLAIITLTVAGCAENFGGAGGAGDSAERLTAEKKSAYKFYARSFYDDTLTELDDDSLTDELWEGLAKCENGERCLFPEESGVCNIAGGVRLSTTDDLLLTDKETGAEYTVVAGSSVNAVNAEDGEPVISVSGDRADGERLWAVYKDEDGGFAALLAGLVYRAGGEPPALLTDRPFEEYEFTGKYTDMYSGSSVKEYSGKVSRQAAEKIWELLCEVEKGRRLIPGDGASYGCGMSSVTATNLRTGETYFISGGSITTRPELCVSEFIVFIGDRIYPSVYVGGENPYTEYAHAMLESLIIEGVVRGENLVGGGNDLPAAGANAPERLTDMSMDEFEMSGYTGTLGGRVTGSAKKRVWEILEKIESSDVIDFDDNDSIGGMSNDCLSLEHTATGKRYNVRESILYADPEEDGGAPIVVIDGAAHGGRRYACYNGQTYFKELMDVLAEVLSENGNGGDDNPSAPEKLTDGAFEDFEFKASAMRYDRDTLTTTKYFGVVPEETARKFWELLRKIESGEPLQYDDDDSANSYGDRLYVTNKRNGKEYSLAEGIFYQHPMEEGGPVVFILDGIPFGRHGYVCYGMHIYGDDNVPPLDAWFAELIDEGVVREENITERFGAEAQIEKRDIVLVSQYVNWAWGYQHYGRFVDFAGNVYEFDLSDSPEIMTDDDFLTALEKRHFDHLFGDPVGTVDDIDLLWDIAGLADKIDENAEIVKEHTAYDAGAHTLYAVTSEHTLVEISSYGDFRRVNTDLNAVMISMLCKVNDIL